MQGEEAISVLVQSPEHSECCSEPESSAGRHSRYLHCGSSSSSLDWEEPREKRVLDLRSSGEMLTEKEIRRAGCGCGSAEKWLTGDVRTGA